MAEVKISEKQQQWNFDAAKKLTLFDDDFMNAVFDGNLDCTAYVLSVILNKELKVTEVKTQYDIRNLNKSGAVLDIRAVDADNKPYNIEVQKTEDEGAQPKRARRNGSLMDASLKSYGKYGELLPETYVIFITAFDYWKKGKPLYDFDRKCIVDGEVLLFGDELHMLYVNGAYRGDDKLGDLMHDFSCANPEDMKSGRMKSYVAPFKTEEGVRKMCKIMEESNKRAVDEAKEEFVLSLLKENMPIDFIARTTKLSEDEIRLIQQQSLVVA